MGEEQYSYLYALECVSFWLAYLKQKQKYL